MIKMSDSLLFIQYIEMNILIGLLVLLITPTLYRGWKLLLMRHDRLTEFVYTIKFFFKNKLELVQEYLDFMSIFYSKEDIKKYKNISKAVSMYERELVRRRIGIVFI